MILLFLHILLHIPLFQTSFLPAAHSFGLNMAPLERVVHQIRSDSSYEATVMHSRFGMMINIKKKCLVAALRNVHLPRLRHHYTCVLVQPSRQSALSQPPPLHPPYPGLVVAGAQAAAAALTCTGHRGMPGSGRMPVWFPRHLTTLSRCFFLTLCACRRI